jgi:hypothetical protein
MIRGKAKWVPPCDTSFGGPGKCNDQCTENKCKSTMCPYKKTPVLDSKRICSQACEDCLKGS